jgi:CubicO group peptidase (beta-lactamase class C family)
MYFKTNQTSAVKKFIKRIILLLVVAALVYGIYYAWFSFPLISGYSAKNACSCIFVQGRTEASVKEQELAGFPFSIGSFSVNWRDSSVTGKVVGLAKRKAIYRKGLGCTLVNEIPESVIRSQTFLLPIKEQQNTDSLYWPSGDRLPDTLPSGINLATLNGAIDFAFAEKDSNKKVHTRAVIVLYKGQLVAEKYGPGFNARSLMLGWSVAKSFANALIGILVKEGKLNLTAPAPVPQWNDKNDSRHAITLENLLQQTSGLDFRENYSSYSNVTNMLFNKADMAGYAAGISLKHTPGTVFNYSSGNSNILSQIIRNTVGEKEYYRFPYTKLFSKLSMQSAFLEPDASGTFVASSYVYATARDYARFGLLYYNDGIWNGERILPDGWVQKTVTSPTANQFKNYGYQFWLNGFDKKDPLKKWYPNVPADMYFADGFGGQDIYIIPSKKLVVVRLGLNGMDEDEFLKRVITAVQ